MNQPEHRVTYRYTFVKFCFDKYQPPEFQPWGLLGNLALFVADLLSALGGNV
jgi:hypothetical protein